MGSSAKCQKDAWEPIKRRMRPSSGGGIEVRQLRAGRSPRHYLTQPPIYWQRKSGAGMSVCSFIHSFNKRHRAPALLGAGRTHPSPCPGKLSSSDADTASRKGEVVAAPGQRKSTVRPGATGQCASQAQPGPAQLGLRGGGQGRGARRRNQGRTF